MELNFFREFVVLADTMNYWEASERLFINQSTLTKHIQQMERELDVLLFERTTRKVELTEYGRLMLPYAREITRIHFEYNEKIQDKKDVENGTIVLGILPSMVQYRITDLMVRYQNVHPDISIKPIEEDSQNMRELLHKHQCRLAFLRDAPKMPSADPDLIKIPYMQDHLVAILPRSHPLAKQKSLHLEQLKNEKFITIKQSTMLYNLCLYACECVGFKPQIVFDTHRIDTILDFVCQEFGVALLMDCHVNRPIHGSLGTASPFAVIDIVPEITTAISLCYLESITLSEAERDFIDHVKQYSREIQEENTTEII